MPSRCGSWSAPWRLASDRPASAAGRTRADRDPPLKLGHQGSRWWTVEPALPRAWVMVDPEPEPTRWTVVPTPEPPPGRCFLTFVITPLAVEVAFGRVRATVWLNVCTREEGF